MAIRIVEFSNGWYKIRKRMPKKQHTQRKLLNFVNWVNGEVSTSAKVWLSKSIFHIKNYSYLSIFFHLRISIHVHIFCYWHFLMISIFKSLSKMMPNFWHLPNNPILKIQKFPLSMLIFRQKPFQFCTTPVWKLHNQYCHSSETLYKDHAPHFLFSWQPNLLGQKSWLPTCCC